MKLSIGSNSTYINNVVGIKDCGRKDRKKERTRKHRVGDLYIEGPGASAQDT